MALVLELPPGVYRVVGRKPGHADAVEEIRIRPKDSKQLDLAMTVQNSVGFQESVQGALEAPREQRATGVWAGLGRAAAHVDARAVLVGRFVADEELERGGLLHVGLYLPGRGGWGFHRTIEVTADQERTASDVNEAIDAVTSSLTSELNPLFLAFHE